MLLTIANWLLFGLAEAMDLFVNMFFGIFDMTAGNYLSYFPVLGTAYSLFRGLGYGLVFVFAAMGLIRFFQPGVFGGKENNDTPGGVLFKAMCAAALVYGGNYILEYIIEIATVPYDAFRKLSITESPAIGNIFSQLAAGLLRTIEAPGIDAGASILVLVIILLVAFNFFKLVIEIAERYLLVGLMLFTSPPFFAMFASADTMQSFKSWIKMFISGCAMMFVSVFSCKLVLSGIASVATQGNGLAGDTLLRLLLVLGMCKAAQKTDGYLKQIGLGTAQTGGSLLEDILAVGRTAGSFAGNLTGGKGGSRTTVLGAAASTVGKYGKLGSRISGGWNEFKREYENGEDPTWKKITEAGRKASEERVETFPEKLVKNLVKPDQEKQSIAGMAKESAVSMYGTLNPESERKRTAAIERSEEKKISETAAEKQVNHENNRKAVQSDNRLYGKHVNAGQPYTLSERELLSKADDYNPKISSYEAREFFDNHGIESCYSIGDDGELTLSPKAVASGIRLDRTEGIASSNNDSAIAEFLNETYGNGAAITFDEKSDGFIRYAESEGREAAETAREEAITDAGNVGIRSIENARTAVAEKMAFDTRYELGGDDGMGSAMINKLRETEEISYSNVRTQNMPEYTDSEGRVFSGGHSVTATYTDSEGNQCEYTAVNEAGFRQLSVSDPEEVKEYRRKENDSGAVYWEKNSVREAQNTGVETENAVNADAGYETGSSVSTVIAPISANTGNENREAVYPDTAEDVMHEDRYLTEKNCIRERDNQAETESRSSTAEETINSENITERMFSDPLTETDTDKQTPLKEFITTQYDGNGGWKTNHEEISTITENMSHTDLFDGKTVNAVRKYNEVGNTAWIADTVDGLGVRKQVIGLDESSWKAMDVETKAKFTPVKSKEGKNTEYVSVREVSGMLAAPVVSIAGQKISPSTAPPARENKTVYARIQKETTKRKKNK